METAAVQKLCGAESLPDLSALTEVWLVPEAVRRTNPREVATLDEAFHQGLVEAAGNREMLRVHWDITEKIRIVRRLDFTKPARIAATYEEHAHILRMILQRKAGPAASLLKSHIETSKAEVRKITLHMLHTARQGARPR